MNPATGLISDIAMGYAPLTRNADQGGRAYEPPRPYPRSDWRTPGSLQGRWSGPAIFRLRMWRRRRESNPVYAVCSLPRSVRQRPLTSGLCAQSARSRGGPSVGAATIRC